MHYEKFQDGTVKCIEDEIPFEVPEGWEWTRLNVISTFELGKTLDSAKNKGIFRPYLRSINVRWNKIDLSDIKEMKIEDDELERYSIKRGDLLICEGGDVGRSCVWDCDQVIYYQNALHRVRFYKNIDPYFYMYIMMYYAFTGKLSEICKGVTIKHLTRETLQGLFFPLPPQDECVRITNKIKEFDDFISTLSNTNDDFLELIKKAKAKILDLAIQGKLVRQNPNDEPASALLERIRAEKEELIKQGKLKRDKKESIIYKGDDNSYYEKLHDGTINCIDEEIPFCIPNNWHWERVRNIFIVNPKNNLDDDISVSFIPMALFDDGYSGRYTHEEKKWKECKKGFTHFANGDVCFAKISPCFENRKSAYLNDLKNGYGAGTTELYVLRGYTEDVMAEYILSFVKSEYFISRGKNTFSGVVGQQRVDKEVMLDTFIPLPPNTEQIRIINKLGMLLAKVIRIEDSIN